MGYPIILYLFYTKYSYHVDHGGVTGNIRLGGYAAIFFRDFLARWGGENDQDFLCNQGQNTAQNTFLKHGLTLVM